MKIIIDLDGTICTEEKTYSRSMATLLPGARESLLKFKQEGYIIIIFSARSWAEYEMTYDWLLRNSVPFDQLVLGKPQGDIWIDDRAIGFNNWESVMTKIK